MPFGHCMFDNPHGYGCVEYGDDSISSKRSAWTSEVQGMLQGWDADMTPDRRDALITATVNAKMNGIETGATPFVAALMASA